MIDRKIALQNFENGCKKWFEKKYIKYSERKILLFGNAAKCAMMIKALDEIGLKKYIVGITCNDSSAWGGVSRWYFNNGFRTGF